jgi:hypothetical protein
MVSELSVRPTALARAGPLVSGVTVRVAGMLAAVNGTPAATFMAVT